MSDEITPEMKARADVMADRIRSMHEANARATDEANRAFAEGFRKGVRERWEPTEENLERYLEEWNGWK